MVLSALGDACSTLVFAKKTVMNEKSIVTISAAGLLLGCVSGIAGSVVPSATFRSLAWALDSGALILAGALLAMYYLRKGYVIMAAGYLIFLIGETVVFSCCATNLDDNISAFGTGTFLWATSISILSTQKIFPLFIRCTGMTSAALFFVVSLLIITGHPVNALTKPLPFYAYPFYAITLAGWAWTSLTKHSRLQMKRGA